MDNVIEMGNYSNSVKELRVLQRKNADSEFVEALYMYDDEEEGLVGTNKLLNGMEFASIQVVREETEELRETLETGLYENQIDDEEIVPWGDGGLIVCQEGVFIWDWETEDYLWVGELVRTLRKKVVHVLKDSMVNMGSSYMPLEQGSFFLWDGEYVAYDDEMNPVVMLAIKPIGCVPMAVPFDKEVLMVREQDFALIGFVD